LLALAVAGGAVAVSVTKPGTTTMRWCFVGLSAAVALGLLLFARTQRRTSRALARTEDRVRVLEQRNRDEGDELHRRVLESITREGELRFAVDVLSMEIARLRASLEGFVPAALAAPGTPEPAAVADTLDLPLVQRVLAAQEASAPEPAAEPVSTWAAAAATPATPTAPVPPAAPADAAPAAPAGPVPPAPAGQPVETVTRSWVVRELQLDEEPGVALTMRILDLTTPPAEQAQPAGSGEGEEQGAWPSFARPA